MFLRYVDYFLLESYSRFSRNESLSFTGDNDNDKNKNNNNKIMGVLIIEMGVLLIVGLYFNTLVIV